MILISDHLRRLGLDGGIMAEQQHPELAERISRFDARVLQPEDILLIHHSFHNGLIDEVVAAPCRKILVYHNVTKPEFFLDEPHFQHAAIRGYEQLWKLRDVVEGAIADSAFNARALEERGFHNVLPLCLLADFESLPNQPHKGAPYHHFDDIFHILFVGRICANKGQHHLVRALPLLEQSLGRRICLTLSGHADHGGTYLHRLRADMKRLGVEDRVNLVGSVTNEELYGYFREADAYVSYSRHEGFGVPLIEAMAFGTPVFAYGSTAIPETLGGAGHMLRSFLPDELANAIRTVFQTRSGWRAFIRRQRRRAAELSISATFPQLIKFLERTFDLPLNLSAGIDPAEVPQLVLEGPLAGSYSLAQVNRNLVLSVAESGQMTVSARPREGTDSFVFDVTETSRTPALTNILETPLTFSAPTIGVRNMYPPRVRGHVADQRLHLLYWEESRLPVDLVRQINFHLDGMLAPTRYCAKVFRDSGVRVPIRVVGQGITNHEIVRQHAHAERRSPFVFVHISSGLSRKGVEELLQAYVRVFTARDDVLLVIKSYQNPSNVIKPLMDRFIGTSASAPRVVIDYSQMTDAQMNNLYAAADAVVLPTRGEGFNLPAAEALKAGRTLLVTGTGAHMDFCTSENAILLKSEFEPSQSHVAEKGSYWARVDVQDLAAKMRAVFEGRLERTPSFSYEMEDWKVVVDNIAAFAADLEQTRPIKERIRLVSISTYNTRCGIAEYAAALMPEFPGWLYDVTHWATVEPPEAAHLEYNVQRLWQHLDGGFEALCRRAVAEQQDAVLIQFNFGFFEIDDFFRGIARLAEGGVLSYIIFHKTADADVHGRTVSLRDHVKGLAQVDRIFVHDIADVNYLAELGLHETVTLVPLFCNEMPDLPRLGVRHALGLKAAGPIVATNGFLLPNKGMPALIEAFAIIRSRLPDAHLIMSTAAFPSGGASTDVAKTCRELIDVYSLQNSVTFITDFLSLEQIHMLLCAADLVVYPYGYSRESASASIRQGLSARRPVLGSSSPIFDNVRAAIETVDKTDAATLADAMLTILSSPEKQEELSAKVCDFIRNQSPRDVVEIIASNIQQDLMERQGVEFPRIEMPKAKIALRPTVLEQQSTAAIARGLLGAEASPEQITAFEAACAGGSVTEAINSLLCDTEYFDRLRLEPQRLTALRLPVIDMAALRALDGIDFIKACYRSILGREGDADGIENHCALLERPDPEVGKQLVIDAMLESDEYRLRVVPRIIINADA